MDDTKTHQMRLERVLRHMEADFLPDYNAPARPSTDVRLAYAAEYAAYAFFFKASRTAGATFVPNSSIDRMVLACGMVPTLICIR